MKNSPEINFIKLKNSPEINFIKSENSKSLGYKSFNFSVGFVSLVFGFLLLGGGAIAFYFTRPCVLGECSVIPSAKNQIDYVLEDVSVNSDENNLVELQLDIIGVILELKTIPRWSNYYSEAQVLITDYQGKVNDIEQLLESLELAKSAENMTAKLPLSLEEWERVENMWLRAIALIEPIRTPFLQSWIDNKTLSYENELEIITENKTQEKQAEELLLLATNNAQKNQELTKNVVNLQDLEIIDENWQKAILSIREIPNNTKPALEKENLLKEYNNNRLTIQEKIEKERKANIFYDEIKENIILAKQSEENNQWSQAVNNWQKVINNINKFPSDTLLNSEIDLLETESKEKLNIAENELKSAINREEAKGEIQKVCDSSGKICDYTVENNLIQVFLTPNYLENIAKITQKSLNKSVTETQQLINHINQVEKNYQYINLKYQIPIEVYNPQKRLLIKYD